MQSLKIHLFTRHLEHQHIRGAYFISLCKWTFTCLLFSSGEGWKLKTVVGMYDVHTYTHTSKCNVKQIYAGVRPQCAVEMRVFCDLVQAVRESNFRYTAARMCSCLSERLHSDSGVTFQPYLINRSQRPNSLSQIMGLFPSSYFTDLPTFGRILPFLGKVK